MKFDIFEGFKRINQIILFFIAGIGLIISYNQDATVVGTPHFFSGTACISDYSKFEDINFGHVLTKFCFDKEYYYSDRSEYADKFALSDMEKSNYEKQAFRNWIVLFIEGIGYTALVAFAYILFCRAVKYIATGFVKKNL